METNVAQRGVRKVIIIGGGIAGPVLGMWLRRAGLQVLLAERRAGSARSEGAFLGVASNGMNVLRALGADARVAALGVPCTAFQFENAAGRPIGSIDRSQDAALFGAPLTMIRRGDLQDVLLEEARQRGVELRLGARLVALHTSEAGVSARFEDGSTEEADLLVGCDGLRSTTRRLLMPEAPEPVFSGLWDHGGFASGVKVPVPPGVNEMVFGKRAFFGAFVTPAGEVWWFHNGPLGPRDGDTEQSVRERLLELHRDDPAWIRDVIRATPAVLGPWPLYDLRDLPRWSKGRVCLIGDAAHAMSPSAGQGASLAMEDAMALAMCLRDVDDPLRALETYERLRRPRVEAIALQARRNGSGKAPSGRASLWLRDLLLPVFLRLGGKSQSRGYAYRLDWESRVA